MIPKTPIPPYYAVIFTSKRTEKEIEPYGKTADRMVELAKKQKGYLGMETYRNTDGYGVTISYWGNIEGISVWKKNMEHRIAQKNGRDNWYSEYKVRIARIERDYEFKLED